MEYEDVLTNQPVVIDNGSGVIKAGFAGTDTPTTYFPSCVGSPKHLRVMAGGLEGDTFIGRNIDDLRGLLKLKYPMEHGVVTDWNNMERIWQYLYSQEFKILSEEHPVLLTEAPLNPRKNRDIAAQIFFETFNVPAMFISIQAVLSLYASGRTTGIVMDAGDGVCHSVPVYDGFAIQNGIQRMDIAGRDVTNYLQLLLRKSGYGFYTSAEREVVRVIKEKTCFVSLNPAREEHDFYGEDFALPDGKIIKVGSERYLAPEIMFKPDIVGSEFPGVHEMLCDSINKVDMDLRRTLYGNIVLSGGSTLFKGFGDRLLQEVKRQAHADVKIKINAPRERKYTTWMGGSILASLSTFRKMWVSSEDYQEDPDIIHRKFF